MTLLHNSVWLETPWHLRIREMMAHVQFLIVRVLERLGNNDKSKIFLLLSFLEFRAREIGETTIKQVVLLRIRLCFLSGKLHWISIDLMQPNATSHIVANMTLAYLKCNPSIIWYIFFCLQTVLRMSWKWLPSAIVPRGWSSLRHKLNSQKKNFRSSIGVLKM